MEFQPSDPVRTQQALIIVQVQCKTFNIKHSVVRSQVNPAAETTVPSAVDYAEDVKEQTV